MLSVVSWHKHVHVIHAPIVNFRGDAIHRQRSQTHRGAMRRQGAAVFIAQNKRRVHSGAHDHDGDTKIKINNIHSFCSVEHALSHRVTCDV